MTSTCVTCTAAYQGVIVVFFLLSLPLNIFLNSAAFTSAVLVCKNAHQKARSEEAAGLPDKHSADLVELAQAKAASTESASQSTPSATAHTASSTGADNAAPSSTSATGAPAAAAPSSSSTGPSPESTASTTSEGAGAAGASSADSSGQGQPEPSKPGLFKRIGMGMADVKAVLPETSTMIKRVW